MKTFIITSIMIIVTWSFSQAETIIIGSFPIPLMVVDQDQGVFVDLVKEAAKRQGLDIQFKVTPPKRTIKHFMEGKNDALFPALDVNFADGIEVEKSEPVYQKVDFVFTVKGQPQLKIIQDLEGKKVAITRGYPYARQLTENNMIILDVANSDEANAKKLMKGRVDAFVVEEKSGLQAFKTLGLLDKVQWYPNVPLSKQKVYVAFQKNAKGKILADKISKSIQVMKTDGTLANIMAGTKK